MRCKLAAHYGTPCSVGFGGASGGGADSVITPHELLSEAKIIACPTCNVAVTKQKGCNHITCTQRVPGTTLACDTDFCFSCGMRIMDVASHYTLSGCKQFVHDVVTETNRMLARITAARETGKAPVSGRRVDRVVVDAALDLLGSAPFAQRVCDL